MLIGTVTEELKKLQQVIESLQGEVAELRKEIKERPLLEDKSTSTRTPPKPEQPFRPKQTGEALSFADLHKRHGSR